MILLPIGNYESCRMTSGFNKMSGLQEFGQRLWRTSPASIFEAIKRRMRNRMAKPAWVTVTSGPAAGVKLFLPTVSEGGLKEMAEGTFDIFLYQALSGVRDLKGAVCWDIGAHIGYHSLGFAAMGATVVAFEPNQYNAKQLQLHLQHNPQLSRSIRYMGAAVADQDGELSFIQSENTRGPSSGSHLDAALTPLTDAYADFHATTVPAVRIDTLIERRHEAPPDVLKIDVEGAETLVLRGGSNFFSKQKPVILMEVHHIRLMHEVQELLMRWGYQIRILDEEHLTPSRCFILAR